MEYFAGINLSYFNFGGHLLDYGSGDGLVSAFFIKKGFYVTSVDIDYDAKNKILSQLTEEEKGRFSFIHLKEKDSLSNYSHKFDYIICREVLEHIKDYHFVIELFNDLLNKSGLCVISVPTYFTEKLFSFFDPKWFEKCEHVNVFKKKDIINLAKSNKFNLEKITNHSFNRTLFWALVVPFRPKHDMGRILNKNKIIKFLEYFSYGVCSFKIIDKIGNLIAPKSRVFYLRQSKNEL